MSVDDPDDKLADNRELCTRILRRYGEAIDVQAVEAFVRLAETWKKLDELCDRVYDAWTRWEKDRINTTVEHHAPDPNIEAPQEVQSDNRLPTKSPNDVLESNDERGTPNNDAEPGKPCKLESPPHSRSDLGSSASQPALANIRPGQFGGSPVERGPGDPIARYPAARFKWSNATVNKSYACRVAIECNEPIEICRIDGLKALGLDYFNDKQCLEGVPAQAGEYSLDVVYRCNANSREQRQTVPFIVNHDPRSLWKDLPSDATTLFWKADQIAQGLEGRHGWLLAGASKRGRSHANRGACRDDDFVVLAGNACGWHILAVADGAGSCELSRESARLAVNAASQMLARQLDEYNEALSRALLAWRQEPGESQKKTVQTILYPLVSKAIYEAVKAIHELAAQQQRPFSDFHTTLLLGAHNQVDNKQLLLGYWIGDGGLVVYESNQRVALLGDSDSGEYAGQTRFLDNNAYNRENIIDRIRFDCRDLMTALILMSDGITDPCFETEHNLRSLERWDEFWIEILQPKLSGDPLMTANRLLEWMDFWSPGNHDDRTLALLYRSEAPS